jgi:hypothetical protein
MHYNIDVDTERKLVITKIYGIWKPETAKEYVEEYQELVKPLLDDKWARLSILTNWKSSYPEIIEIIGGHMRWCLGHGAQWITYVIDNPVTVNQLRKIINIGDTEKKARMFKTLKEAEHFLSDHGF